MDAFVNVWKDTYSNKRYIGSHKGKPDDGYICSSKMMMEHYNQRPVSFIRKVLTIVQSEWIGKTNKEVGFMFEPKSDQN
jgi:hypothetical protein